MSIMDRLFGAKSAPAPVAQSNNPMQNAPMQQTAQGNGTVPAGADAAPMDKFKDLWEAPKESEATADQQVPPGIDPKKLMEAASKVDFSAAIDADLMNKIQGGGEDAMKALVTAMNRVAQQTYGQSAVMTARVVEQAVAKAQEEFGARVPETIRRQNTRAAVLESNPVFNNPSIAPMIEAQVQQLATKFPQATPKELESLAKEYFMGMADLLKPSVPDASSTKKTGPKEEDWSTYDAN